MAGSPEAQRLHQAALRRMNARLRREFPDMYRRWMAQAKAEIAAETEAEETSP